MTDRAASVWASAFRSHPPPQRTDRTARTRVTSGALRWNCARRGTTLYRTRDILHRVVGHGTSNSRPMASEQSHPADRFALRVRVRTGKASAGTQPAKGPGSTKSDGLAHGTLGSHGTWCACGPPPQYSPMCVRRTAKRRVLAQRLPAASGTPHGSTKGRRSRRLAAVPFPLGPLILNGAGGLSRGTHVGKSRHYNP